MKCRRDQDFRNIEINTPDVKMDHIIEVRIINDSTRNDQEYH